MSTVIQAHQNPWPEKLKAIRDKYDLTQAEAAEMVGVAKITWVTWEHGRYTPGRLTRPLLKRAFPKDF